MIGRVLGGCELIERIGHGGMGTVYRAFHHELQLVRAVKVLKSDFGHEQLVVERFKREARDAARLRHPKIVQIHDMGEQNGDRYLVMEFINRTPLNELLRKDQDFLIRAQPAS